MTEYIVRETGFPGTLKKEVVGEIVRCKDYVWYDERRPYSDGYALYECRNLERFLQPDFFCKDGERREDEKIHQRVQRQA